MLQASPALMNDALTLRQINALSKESFHDFFKDIVVAHPEYFHKVWSLKPFRSTNRLIDTFLSQLDDLDKYDKLIIINKYGLLMHFFVNKFNSDPRHQEIEDRNQFSMLVELLSCYKEKFYFPFIFNPADRNLLSIYRELDYRINNTEASEMNLAMYTIKQLALRELEKRIR